MTTRRRSTIAIRGKSSSTWANCTPPSKQNIGTAKANIQVRIPIADTILAILILAFIFSLVV